MINKFIFFIVGNAIWIVLIGGLGWIAYRVIKNMAQIKKEDEARDEEEFEKDEEEIENTDNPL